MTAVPTRFTFDLDLTRRNERNRIISEERLATLLREARMAGYAEGFTEGERGATAMAAKTLSAAAETLAHKAVALLATTEEANRRHAADAVALAASIGRKLAGNLLARFPTGEIEALIRECLASLDNVPHLVIRCHPRLADAVRDIATARIQVSGFTGRLIVMGDPDQTFGDGRLEWAAGGLVRDIAAISTEIDARIAAYLAAAGTTKETRT